jgi:hypothetical protein
MSPLFCKTKAGLWFPFEPQCPFLLFGPWTMISVRQTVHSVLGHFSSRLCVGLITPQITFHGLHVHGPAGVVLSGLS